VSVFGSHSLVTRVFKTLFGKFYIPYKLRKIIEKERPDCIHSHLGVLKYLSAIEGDLKDISLLYTCHNVPSRMIPKGSTEWNAAKSLIDHRQMQLIALHPQMAKDLNESFGIDNTAIINNGVNFKAFRGIEKTKEEIRCGLGISPDAFLVGHVGRFSAQKNHLFLLDIFKEITRRSDKAFLLLIGNGELEDKIREKIKDLALQDKVMMLSHRTDIPELLKAMDVFLFPSLYEGLPVTMVEAQAVGLRCVISDTIDENSILLPTTVVHSLKDSVSDWAETVLNNSLTNHRCGNIEDYNMETAIKKLEGLYR
jgi:glycosyltransferase involved in cell wall biosynthesis